MATLCQANRSVKLGPPTRFDDNRAGSDCGGDASARPILVARRQKSLIIHLEVNDLNFEFVFPEYLVQDGSGEKGLQGVYRSITRHFFLPCGRECPSLSR